MASGAGSWVIGVDSDETLVGSGSRASAASGLVVGCASIGTSVGCGTDSVSEAAASTLLLTRVSGCGVGSPVVVARVDGKPPVECSASPVCAQAVTNTSANKLKAPISHLRCWRMFWLVIWLIFRGFERRALMSANSELPQRSHLSSVVPPVRYVQFRRRGVTGACVRAGASGTFSRMGL